MSHGQSSGTESLQLVQLDKIQELGPGRCRAQDPTQALNLKPYTLIEFARPRGANLLKEPVDRILLQMTTTCKRRSD